MSEGRTFLLEVGCEEIPAAALPAALSDLTRRLLEELASASGGEGLGGASSDPVPYGGPRRLTAFLTGIRDREPDRVIQVSGPPVKAAYDAAGKPTKAAIGFARAQGIDVESLERVRGDKGEVVAARVPVKGRSAVQVLSESCPRILAGMRFPKMMKWGDAGYSFVRPVHWIVALLDGEIVPFEFMGVAAGRATRGHRFLAPGPHEIDHAGAYETTLLTAGKVVASNGQRRQRIVDARALAAQKMGWQVHEDEALLEELTWLNENPGVIAGTFPADLLDLPEPVLVTSMRVHQKYFPARAADGRLQAGFFAAINQESDPDGLIRRGNEWVLKARLADARFFWAEDRKRPLLDRLPDLDRVTFLEKLGSNLERARRLETLAGWIQAKLRAGTSEAVRLAARLCKTDLTTGMVGEFPELQGVMGGIYARLEGQPEPVARAIEEHYLPRGTDDDLPSTVEGQLLALADKLDLITGCFSVGLVPKGSADPYGLRRAAQGALRILLSPQLETAAGRLLLSEAIRESTALHEASRDQAVRIEEPLMDFVGQRLRHMMETAGMRFDTARAVLSAGFDDPRDAWHRAVALTELRSPDRQADFDSLATSAKRIRNILSQARDKEIAWRVEGPDTDRLVEGEEKDLAAAVSSVSASVEQRIGASDYNGALKEIASLRPRIDRFFDKVLVMTPDEDLRSNRLALLAGLSALLSRVADFSEIVVEGETAEKRA